MTKRKPTKNAKAARPAKAPEPSATPSGELTFEGALRESNAREALQKPFRKQFEKCKTLDKLAALVAKNKATYDTVPWVSWICRGPGDDKKWAESRDKVDAKKQKALAKILGDLITNGAELAVVDEEGRLESHSLAQILGFDELTPAQRLALLQLAIEHGADPADRIGYPLWGSETGPCHGYHATRSALDAALDDEEHPEFLAAILPHVTRGVLEDAYLRHAIHRLRYSMTGDEWAAKIDRAGSKLDRIVSKLQSTDRAALVHFLCEAEAKYEFFEKVIDRVDVNLPLPGALTTSVSIEWGLVPTIRLPQGATPLDIVDAIIGFVRRSEAANTKKPDKSFRPDDAVKIRELAAKKRERLLARGAKKSEQSGRLDLPPVLAETGEQLLRLANLVGADETPIREAMAAIDTDGMGPWGFLHAVVPTFESELVSAKLDAPSLTRLLTAFTSDRWSNELRKSELPANTRASVEIAIEFDDDARLLAVKTGGATQIWKLASDSVTVVAPSVPEYLKTEIDRWQS